MKAIKKPIEIDYFPCEDKYYAEIMEWDTKERPIEVSYRNSDGELELKITTPEGVHIATKKDVIILGINKEVYPCKKDIFKEIYTI